MANSNPGLFSHQVPTAAQWNAYFTAKVDASGGEMTGGTIDSSVIGGTTPAAGTFTTSNVTDRAGIKMSGISVMRAGNSITIASILGGGTQQSLFIGQGAGAAFNLSTDAGFSSTGIGTDALAALTATNAENTAVGARAAQYVTTGANITALGMGANGFDNANSNTAVGSDSIRDAFTLGGVTAVGAAAGAHGYLGAGVVAVGLQAMLGNSSVVILTGTKTTGNTITIGCTSATSGLTGLPMSVTYTVLAGDTMATIAAGLAALVFGSVYGLKNLLECFVNTLPGGAYALTMVFPGNNTHGWALQFTASTSGGATVAVSVGNGAIPTAAVMIGGNAGYGAAMGSIANITVVGASAGLSLITSPKNTLIGSFAGTSITTGSGGNVVVGEFAGWLATTLSGSVIVGSQSGQNATVGTGLTILGAGGGQGITNANWVTSIGENVGATSNHSGMILIGSGIQAVESSVANAINIENILKVTGTGTPATSAATFAGSLAITGGIPVTATTAPLIVSGNPGTTLAVSSTTLLEVVGPDTSNARIEITSFGGNASFIGRRANGTQSSPTAVQSTDTVMGVAGIGYGATTFSGLYRLFNVTAAENWTDTAQGMFITINTVQIGTTTQIAAMRFQDNGVITIGTTTASGTNKLQVTGGVSTDSIAVSGFVAESVATGLAAAGTTRADALALTKQRNVVNTAAAGTGVVLAASATVGVGGWQDIDQKGANPIKVYAAGSDTIDTVAGSTGVTLTNAKRCRYSVDAAGAWVSAQWGVPSA